MEILYSTTLKVCHFQILLSVSPGILLNPIVTVSFLKVKTDLSSLNLFWVYFIISIVMVLFPEMNPHSYFSEHKHCFAVRTQYLLIRAPPHLSPLGRVIKAIQGTWPASQPPTILTSDPFLPIYILKLILMLQPIWILCLQRQLTPCTDYFFLLPFSIHIRSLVYILNQHDRKIIEDIISIFLYGS